MIKAKTLAYKPGAGEDRDYWAIKRWLHENGFTLADISRALGINHGIISSTIRGTRNTRRVLKWLLENGCPAAIISLPDDLKTKANR